MTAIIEANADTILQCIFCIWYPLHFQEIDQDNEVKTLINFGSKINTIIPTYIKKLGSTPCKTRIRAQKMDDITVKIYGMALAVFLIQDSLERVQFFGDTFLLIDIRMEIILRMSFLSLSNLNIEFAELEKFT